LAGELWGGGTKKEGEGIATALHRMTGREECGPPLKTRGEEIAPSETY